MLELVISALITLLPDYLYRRYRQGKRLGHEITLFNVWYELRWGITGCVSLAIVLITVIFYFHPTTQVVISILDYGVRMAPQKVRSWSPIRPAASC